MFEYYDSLLKPTFAPPAWLFAPAWTVLYILIAISFGYSFYKIAKGDFPKSLLSPLLINLASNLLFTPIQFGLRDNVLAAIDITIVWLSIIWIIKEVCHYKKWVAYMQIPYLLWVSFAMLLQFSIVIMNL